MANPILENTDFTDEYKISFTCFSEEDLDAYIVRYEKYYLTRLLGAELYTLFIADLTGNPSVPTAPRFTAIFDAFDDDNDGGTLISSEGMKEMLKQFVYFHFTRDQVYKASPLGRVKPESSISSPPSSKGYNLVESFNKGLCNYNAIQWYIDENSTDYPEENMQHIGGISGI